MHQPPFPTTIKFLPENLARFTTKINKNKLHTDALKHTKN